MPLTTRRFGGLSRVRQGEALVWGLWLTAIVVLEVLGRHSPSDAYDAAGVAVLYGLVILTAWAHHRHPLRLLAFALAGVERLRGRVMSWSLVAGIDFRREPPIRRRFPPRFALLILALWLIAAALWVLRDTLPAGARAAALQVSSSLTLALVAVLWAAMAGCGIVMIILTVVLMHVAVRRFVPGYQPRHRAHETTVIAFYLITLFVTALVVPGWVALAIIVGCLGGQALLTLLPGPAAVLVMWSPRGRPEAAAVTTWQRWRLAQEGAVAGGLLVVALLASGARLYGHPDPSTPVSSTLGLFLAWSAAALYPVPLLIYVAMWRNGWFHNPARPCPTAVHVSGFLSDATRTLVPRALVMAGMAPRFHPEPPRREDVRIQLAPREHSDGSWPLCIEADDLDDETVLEAIRRRDQIQRRRHLLAGLRRAFKEARADYARGNGFWVAPHLWYVDGLTRDEEDESDFGDIVGPHFRAVLPLSARSHFHEIMDGLDLDLLFVEDGVTYRQLTAVIRMMFELWDIHGGRQRAEDRHFFGLRGVRVIIHELGPLSPFEGGDYPEPDYEDIGRARILHVFRDRGEHEEETPAPVESDWIDSPVLVG